MKIALGFLLLLVSSILGHGSTDANQEPRKLPDTLLVSPDGHLPPITLTHEVIFDPSVSNLFALPVDVAIGPNLRQYHVDAGPKDVKVLTENGEHLFSITGPGHEGRRFIEPSMVAISADGKLCVYDGGPHRLEVFATSGEYLYSLSLTDMGDDFEMRDLLFLDNAVLAVAGLSLEPEYYGYAIHIFEIIGSGNFRHLSHLRSIAETPWVEPAVYHTVTGGRISLDQDGLFLYNQRAPYGLRKLGMDGTVIWAIDDEATIPPATAFFGVTREGRIQVRYFPYSSSLFSIDEDLYLHAMVFPPEGYAGSESPFPRGTPLRSQFEVIGFRQGEVLRRTFEVEEPITYVTQDKEGRLYGELRREERILIKSTIEVGRCSRATPATASKDEVK
jgi:hypothetical protein